MNKYIFILMLFFIYSDDQSTQITNNAKNNDTILNAQDDASLAKKNDKRKAKTINNQIKNQDANKNNKKSTTINKLTPKYPVIKIFIIAVTIFTLYYLGGLINKHFINNNQDDISENDSNDNVDFKGHNSINKNQQNINEKLTKSEETHNNTFKQSTMNQSLHKSADQNSKSNISNEENNFVQNFFNDHFSKLQNRVNLNEESVIPSRITKKRNYIIVGKQIVANVFNRVPIDPNSTQNNNICIYNNIYHDFKPLYPVKIHCQIEKDKHICSPIVKEDGNKGKVHTECFEFAVKGIKWQKYYATTPIQGMNSFLKAGISLFTGLDLNKIDPTIFVNITYENFETKVHLINTNNKFPQDKQNKLSITIKLKDQNVDYTMFEDPHKISQNIERFNALSIKKNPNLKEQNTLNGLKKNMDEINAKLNNIVFYNNENDTQINLEEIQEKINVILQGSKVAPAKASKKEKEKKNSEYTKNKGLLKKKLTEILLKKYIFPLTLVKYLDKYQNEFKNIDTTDIEKDCNLLICLFYILLSERVMKTL